MRANDYIADFLAEHGIRQCYGYQGTMIAFFVDAICRNEKLKNHVCYNEQGAAFAAVGEAKITGRPAVAYATSGPGAANMISGIADAYFDSVPVLFFTGQLNTYEYYDIPGLKQHGFQEMNIVDMVKPVTKYAVQVKKAEDLPKYLEKAFQMMTTGRPGPVLLDLPMNIQRAEFEYIKSRFPREEKNVSCDDPGRVASEILIRLKEAKRPLLLLGNGAGADDRSDLRYVIDRLHLPVVTSLLGIDILPADHSLNYGYIGYSYGHRYANLIINKKTDLIISLGCNLNHRQTGMKPDHFAKGADLIRVDIDRTELCRKIHDNDICFSADVRQVIRALKSELEKDSRLRDAEEVAACRKEWNNVCKTIKDSLVGFDKEDPKRKPNQLISKISDYTEEAGVVVCDVGQHQMWGAQSYQLKEGQRMIFSGGHGAMGFSVPAAIGAAYACGRPVITLTGDGSLQMNIQELQWLHREKLPVTIFVMNNRALGLIHQQQDALFNGRYFSSVKEGGYETPDFSRIANAYGIKSYRAEDENELQSILECLDLRVPNLVELLLPEDSYASPKTLFGDPMHNQSPLIPEDMMRKLLSL